jgi:hypothetical protein
MQTDELELGSFDDRPQRVPADMPGGELHHSQGHSVLPQSKSVMVLSPASYRTPGNMPPSISIVVPLM